MPVSQGVTDSRERTAASPTSTNDLAWGLLSRSSFENLDAASILVEVLPENLPEPARVADAPLIRFVRESECGADSFPSSVDLVIPDEQLTAVYETVRQNPQAALVLTHLLRATETLPIPEALRLESMAYSLLQSGSEFARWLATRAAKPTETTSKPTVQVEEGQDATRIWLSRPERANALNMQMRNELITLIDALQLTAGAVELHGAGTHFCAGGDLDEFGQAADPILAHLQRLSQNVPGAMASIAQRLTAYVHGACIGAGMELSSFAARIVAHPSSIWRLPETSMGLLPGCGGTVSIPRRIGRQRTLLLALSGMSIGANTALYWGLVDEVQP